MQSIKNFLNQLATKVSQLLAKVKLGGAVKAVFAAVGPFVTIWITTGQVDERAIGAAAVGAILVYFFPNITPAGEPTDQTT